MKLSSPNTYQIEAVGVRNDSEASTWKQRQQDDACNKKRV